MNFVPLNRGHLHTADKTASPKDEKEKRQYQDSICSEAEEQYGDKPWEKLYDDVVDPATSQPSKWTTGVFPLA